MQPEDLKTVVNLREVRSTESKTKIQHLLANEDLGVAVDDREHAEVTHFAKTVSVRDLHERMVTTSAWPLRAADSW